jgi:prophage antirepressor-like protein
MIIKEFQTKQITMIQDDDKEIWFKGVDVATILGYANTKQAIIMHVDKEDKQKVSEITGVLKPYPKNIQPQTIFINESGLYSLILRSKLEAAKQFKRWVTKEVLPSIRKTKTYTMPEKEIDSLKLRELQMKEAQLFNLLGDAKIRQAFSDRLMNELQETDKQGPKDEWARDVVTLVKDEIGKRVDFTEAAAVGKYITKRYRKKFNKEPEKYDKFVNGNHRKVNAYTKTEEVHIIEWIHEYYPRDN